MQGCKLAHKKMLFRRKIGNKEKKEIEILKRLSHTHVVQLVGTYTQRRFLGILLNPVAVCDIHTLFEDIEAWTATKDDNPSHMARLQDLDQSHQDRLTALGYSFPSSPEDGCASLVYSRIGCLISAIAYLHEQKIRHKDLKPSNILLSRDGIWLSDFGSATDFTMLSQSATDNERGTPRYFAPEMAAWQPCGRAADMFSLGCIILEILVLHHTGSLEHIRQNRSPDPSFHANLDKIDTWLSILGTNSNWRLNMLQWEVKDLLAKKPADRPIASDLLMSIVFYENVWSRQATSMGYVLSACCRDAFISRRQHEEQISELQKVIALQKEDLSKIKKQLKEKDWQIKEVFKDLQSHHKVGEPASYEKICIHA